MTQQAPASPIPAALGRDVLASIVVFLAALPLCMGIAIASGVLPALGLVTGMVGGLVVGPLAGSPLQVSGPAAGMAVLAYQLVQEHGLVMPGVVGVLAGVLRLGQWFRAISPSVIHGMPAGIGVLILASQIHVMLDDAPRASGLRNLAAIPEAVIKLFPMDGSVHHLAAMAGLVTIASIVLWNRFRPKRMALIRGATDRGDRGHAFRARLCPADRAGRAAGDPGERAEHPHARGTGRHRRSGDPHAGPGVRLRRKLDHIDHACREMLSSWEKLHQSTGGTLIVEWSELVERCGRRAGDPSKVAIPSLTHRSAA